jgi:hypothetical protein
MNTPLLVPLKNRKVEVESDCYRYLTALVRSSSFPFEYVAPNKINVLIDDDSNSVVSAQLIFETDGSGEAGWIEYRVLEHKLMNTSANLDEPKELIFDKSYADKYDKCKRMKK